MKEAKKPISSYTTNSNHRMHSTSVTGSTFATIATI